MLLSGGTDAGEPRPDAARRSLRPSIRHIRRHPQVYFRTVSRRAPYFEVRAELLRSLPHSDEAKVPRPPPIENGGVDPSSIVANPDVQRSLAVDHLSFDVSCVRVPKRVAQRLAADTESFLAYDRVQIPASSLGAHAKHC